VSARALFAFALALLPSLAIGGPVDEYREGPRYCPRDRAAGSASLDERQLIERARALLPDEFCGPSTFVGGCDVIAEQAFNSWRIYFHQYRLRDGRRDWGGLTHTYVVLDAVGNCYANIPGTEQGARR
jgi:hypothetical protein